MIYTIDHIPKSTPCNRRPALPMTATTITIHNTGNPSSSASNERSWLTNPSNGRQASYHIVVDEREAIECLPLNENAWHAGDGGQGPGNRTSIGIELCESGDYAKTLDNAANLAAKMLAERGWGVDRLRRHFDWSGKICPRLMYKDGHWAGWIAFVNLVEYKLKAIPKEEAVMEELRNQIEQLQKRIDTLEAKQSMPVPSWAEAAVAAAVKAGVVDTPGGGSYDFYRTIAVLHRKGLI